MSKTVKKFLLLIICLLCAVPCLNSNEFRVSKNRVAGRSFNTIASNAGYRRIDGAKQTVYRKGKSSFVFNTPRREFYFNGIKFMPGYAPEKKLVRRRWYWRKENDIAISNSDWYSTFRILLNPASVPRHKVRTITLDAGHGGSDTGAIGKISREKNITLKITRRTAAILRACGYNVLLTRYRDNTVPLKSRAAIQRRHKSDLFVSIHVNATANRSIRGIETFALTPADAPSSHGKSELKRNPANVRDANNFLLAYSLQRALLSRTRAADRGVKRARFAVLKDISAPGALVEVGFISNPAEEKLLNSSAYIEKVSRAIAEGILTYHRTVARSR